MHEHRWSIFFLQEQGKMVYPCVDENCDKAVALGNGTMELVAWPTRIDGISLDLIDTSESGLTKYVCRDFERKHLQFLNSISFKPGDIIVDIGAHIGIPSIYLAKKYPKARILAVEPHPDNFRVLTRNVKANKIDNIELYNLAVTNDWRKVKLSYPKFNSAVASEFTKNSMSVEVNSITLQDFFDLNGVMICKYLNLNCEGAEYEIINGNPSLFNRVNYLSGELHHHQTLSKMGYTVAGTYQLLLNFIKADRMSIVGLSNENGQFQDEKIGDTTHKHKWAYFGIVVSGEVAHPCVDKECEASIICHRDGSYSLGLWPTAIGNIRLDLQDPNENGLTKYILKEYERSFLKLVDKIHFSPGDIIVDIGAYVGVPSIYLAKRFPDVKIFAIEPHPDNYKALLRNLKVNKVDNVESFNMEISNDGRIKLNYSKKNNVTPSGFVCASNSCDMDTISPDFFILNKIDKCKYMNMDCEGSEHEIITSNPKIFDLVEYFTGEFHINNRLAAMGYNIAKTYEILCKYINPKNISIDGLSGENGAMVDSVDEEPGEPCPVCGDKGIVVDTEGNIDFYECIVNHHSWEKRR